MLFDPINVLKELEKQRARRKPADRLLDEAQQIFHNDEAHEARIKQQLSFPSTDARDLRFLIPHLDGDDVFLEKDIYSICSRFRLRFLDSDLFKGDIPHEAISKIKTLERKHHVQFKKFMIIAPSERFLLEDSRKDPLLFATLGNGKFLHIHTWGNELAWYRQLLNFPFRNIETLALSAFILGLLIALFIPAELFTGSQLQSAAMQGFARVFTFFLCSGFVFISALIFGIRSFRDFSENVWNSKYFN